MDGLKVRRFKFYRSRTSGDLFVKDGAQEGYDFVPLSGFHYARYDEISGFADMVNYYPDEKVGDVWCSVHPLLFFDVEEPCNFFEEGDHKKDKFFMITTISFNRWRLFDYPGFEKSAEIGGATVKDLFNDLVGEIEKFKTTNFDKEASMGLEYAVYGCLGAADALLVARSANLNDLLSFCSGLRGIPMPVNPIKDDTIKKDRPRFFRHSNSLFAVHSGFDLKSILNDVTRNKASVIVNYALRDFDCAKGLATAYEKMFPGTNSQNCHRRTYGDFDVSIYLENQNLAKMLYIWGVRNIDPGLLDGGKGEFLCGLNLLEEMNGEGHITSSFRRHLGDTIEPGDKEDLEEPLHVKNRIKSRNKMITKLRLLKIKAIEDGKIPGPAIRTAEYVVDRCIGMLRDKSNIMLGIRFYTFLDYAFKEIIDNNIKGEVVISCFGQISSTVDTALMANNITTEHLAFSDVETINQATKMFYAYEGALRTIYNFLNYNDPEDEKAIKPMFFLTVSPLEGMVSHTHLDKNLTQETDPVLYSLNMPDATYFDPQKSMPYYSHEIGHHIAFGGTVDVDGEEMDLNVLRNRILLDLVKYKICNEVIEASKSFEWWDYRSHTLHVKLHLDLCENEFFSGNFFKSRHRDFKGLCEDYVAKVLSAAWTRSEELKSRSYEDDVRRFWDVFSFILGGIVQDRRFVEYFRDSLREARADLIALWVSGLRDEQSGFYGIFLTHFRHMESYTHDSFKTDLNFLWRMSAIFEFFGHEEVEKLKNKVSHNHKHREFHEYIQNYMKDESNREYAQMIAFYLDRCDEYLREKFNQHKNQGTKSQDLEDALFMFSANRCDEDINPLAQAIYRQWFSNIQAWAKKLQ